MVPLYESVSRMEHGMAMRRFAKVSTVEPLHKGLLGERQKWPLWRGCRYGEVGSNMLIPRGH